MTEHEHEALTTILGHIDGNLVPRLFPGGGPPLGAHCQAVSEDS